MRRCSALVLVAVTCSIVSTAEQSKYLPTIEARWKASDLVCTGVASRPLRTGVTRNIDGYDRDQLSSEVTLETCFKGKKPSQEIVQVIGYSYFAETTLIGGIVYSGPPIGFLRGGRNLLFLRKTRHPHRWTIAVPVYETAIRLADGRPYYPPDLSISGTRFALTQEFEAALLQFDDNDVSDIDRIIELLGAREGVGELASFSERARLPVQRDIAVALLNRGQLDAEPQVISLMMDGSAPAWKRAHAAEALGTHGTERAFRYLTCVVDMQVTTDDLGSLRLHAIDSLKRLQRRLGEELN